MTSKRLLVHFFLDSFSEHDIVLKDVLSVRLFTKTIFYNRSTLP